MNGWVDGWIDVLMDACKRLCKDWLKQSKIKMKQKLDLLHQSLISGVKPDMSKN
jgi:hypothetical protein